MRTTCIAKVAVSEINSNSAHNKWHFKNRSYNLTRKMVADVFIDIL